MKKITILLLMVVLLASCTTRQKTDTGVEIESKIDSNLYHVTLQLEEDVGGYSEQNATMFLYDTYARAVMWQDGKGIVRGELQVVKPPVNWAQPENTLIVKTTDYKVTALRPGDTVTLVCVADYEPVCAKNHLDGRTGDCIDLWEFDYCRIESFEEGELK